MHTQEKKKRRGKTLFLCYEGKSKIVIHEYKTLVHEEQCQTFTCDKDEFQIKAKEPL